MTVSIPGDDDATTPPPDDPTIPLKVVRLVDVAASWRHNLLMVGKFELSRTTTVTEDKLHEDAEETPTYGFHLDPHNGTIESKLRFQVDTIGTVVEAFNQELAKLEEEAKEVDARVAATQSAAWEAAARAGLTD